MTTATSGIGSSNTSSGSASSSFAKVNTDDFLKLMITELQNQDPLDPTDSSEFLQQVTLIRQIGANDKLTETLGQVLAGQELTSASSMIGKTVVATDTKGQSVTGKVDRVTLDTDDNTGSRTMKIHVGSQAFDLKSIQEIKQSA